ncbi:hypothetical protein EA462_07070 [Natrarchaeobius halalkaliphilus]|uniref:Halobacterial output domain-containing protein n=1 Tax=Natrarchaeobius halalkaliphilus TaxID=1679091 RepID=A0A3N6LLD6_9EURY|nr:HalOD1 output domain-containing protein [Natrarchaeobius halalkaliphilus]RQG89773.1 hypothetical protein EA462_07070 [Natrarchaeobius halalkaliphilus]
MSSPDKTSPPRDAVPPSQAIIEAIAAHEGVDVTEIEPPEYEPLYEVVNPEALDSLFRTPARTSETTRLLLEYEGYDVTVYGDGRVEVTDSSHSNNSVGTPIED